MSSRSAGLWRSDVNKTHPDSTANGADSTPTMAAHMDAGRQVGEI